jgi:hypothetical protein
MSAGNSRLSKSRLALGDVTIMLFWLLVDWFTARTGHQLMPQ